jgi:hypothetical protein
MRALRKPVLLLPRKLLGCSTNASSRRGTRKSSPAFARIRNAQLRRFTLDLIISILGKLDEEIEVSVTFKPRQHEHPNIS